MSLTAGKILGRFVCYGNRKVIGTAKPCVVNISHNSRQFSAVAVDDDIFGLTDDQKHLRKTVTNFLQKELAPYVDTIDKENVLVKKTQLWKKLGKMGLHGVTIPVEYGGTELGILEHLIVMEEISRVSCAFWMSYIAHSNLCLKQITNNGTHEQKLKFIPKLISGEHCGALAISESDAGSDAMSIKLESKFCGDHYVLNGQKSWVTNGIDANIIIVFAKTDLSVAPTKGITAFIVEREYVGLSTKQRLDTLGCRGANTCDLVFTNCQVPKENVLGDIGGGAKVLMAGLNVQRLGAAAGPIGLMQAVMDHAIPYLHQRKQFGQRIGEFQLMQGKMADMYTRLSACRCYLYTLARSAQRGHLTAKDCAGVALVAAEAATQIALDGIQCLGGNGYINDYPMGRFLRDARLFTIGAGTAEIRRLIIGRSFNEMFPK